MAKKRILIVEDSEDVRANLQEILEWANYEVIVAKNGKAAVDYALKEQPDLIICDIIMPELDGYGVLNLLNRKPETATIPFIFLTGKSDIIDHRKGMNLGADDYLTKPYENADLLEAVEVRLKKTESIKKQNEPEVKPENGYVNYEEGKKLVKDLFFRTEARKYKKKEFIYRQYTQPHLVYFLSKGMVKLVATTTNDKEYITDLSRSGDVFGYTALLLQTKYAESAIALTDAEIYSIPKDDFLELLHSNKNVSGWLLYELVEKQGKNQENLMNLAYASVRKRIAKALLYLHDLYQLENREEIEIMRDDLANIAGAAKETIVRTLRDFKDEGLISIKGRKIVLLNSNALQEVPD